MTLFLNRLGSRSIVSRCIRSLSTVNKCRGDKDHKSSEQSTYVIVGTAAAALFSFEVYRRRKAVLLEAEFTDDDKDAGNLVQGLPSYTLAEVAQHSSAENKVWVTYKRGVYDITSFVAKHPGGDQIMLAAGSSVDPFWHLYGVHKQAQVFGILESMRIGNLSEEEARDATGDMSDPYGNEPLRHKALKPASQKPFNAEPPPSLLVDSFITPNELFYVRNHLPVPEVDARTYELEIEIEGSKVRKSLSLSDIKRFPKHTITATVMCAGNRRSEMSKVKTVKGLDWQNAAVGNATWSGARLSDVLKTMGINEDSKHEHIQFEGLDIDTTSKPYGASIPFWKGVDKRGDVILAYEMNGQELPRDHGYPIRVVVPGVVGARNVKWLGRIVLSNVESDSHWQQNDYKSFSPSVDWDTVDFTKSPAIQELPVMSSICRPMPGDVVNVVDGYVTVQGYAWSGGGNKIIRVDVTIDGGETWQVANIDVEDDAPPPRHWSWTLWTAKIPVPKTAKTVEIWAKAVDSSCNTQPESFKNIWNLRGVLSNAYHRVPVTLKHTNKNK